MLVLTAFGQFLGQQNITNAYVSGMKEDLNAQGNELNYFVVACVSGPAYLCALFYADNSDNTAYVIGQIPLMTLQTKAKM
jgi:ACS family pantothenate transporter-like MFS transporter